MPYWAIGARDIRVCTVTMVNPPISREMAELRTTVGDEQNFSSSPCVQQEWFLCCAILQSVAEGPANSSASTPRSHFQLQPGLNPTEEQHLRYRPQHQQPSTTSETQSILSRLEAMETYLRTIMNSINCLCEPDGIMTRSCRIPPVLSVPLLNYHSNIYLTVMLIHSFPYYRNK